MFIIFLPHLNSLRLHDFYEQSKLKTLVINTEWITWPGFHLCIVFVCPDGRFGLPYSSARNLRALQHLCEAWAHMLNYFQTAMSSLVLSLWNIWLSFCTLFVEEEAVSLSTKSVDCMAECGRRCLRWWSGSYDLKSSVISAGFKKAGMLQGRHFENFSNSCTSHRERYDQNVIDS